MATVPTIKKALPIREIRKQIRHLDKYLDGRVVGTTHEYDRVQPPGDRARAGSSPRPTTSKVKNYAVLAHETAKTLFPYEDPIGQTVKLGSDYYTVVGVTRNAPRRPAIGGSLVGPGVQQGRLHPFDHLPAPVRRQDHEQPHRLDGGRGDPALADHPPGRPIDEVRPDAPGHRGAPSSPGHPRRRMSTSSSPTNCCSRPSARPGNSASSWARSRRFRCWSAASAS